MSKNQLRKLNFYFSIINLLKQTSNLKLIQNKLNISKQNLNYYIRRLKEKGIIKSKGYGFWELTEKSKNLTNHSNFLPKDFIRGHAYVWKIKFPKEIRGWENRIEILRKNNINFKLVGAKLNTPRIKALGRKVWLCNENLRIYEKKDKSYYGSNSIESKKQAFEELMQIVRVIENKLKIKLKPLIFESVKEHYSLIKNDLAIEHNKKGIILRISDEDGEWLLIDDSLEQGGELENVGKKSLVTNNKMQRWWNEHKATNFDVTPNFILNSLAGLIQVQSMNAENIIKHQNVLDEMLITMKKIQESLHEKNNKG